MNFNRLSRPNGTMTEHQYRQWQDNQRQAKLVREGMMTKADIIKEAHQGGMKDYFAKLLGVNIAETLIDCGLLRTCLNCDNWNSINETCTAAGGKRPPAKVIVTGCEAHTDIIPF